MSDARLGEAYRRELADREPTDRSGCPTPEEIQDIVDRSGPEADRLTRLDHVMACPACLRDLELLRAIGAAERRERSTRWRLPATLAASVAGLLALTAVWQMRQPEPPDFLRDTPGLDVVTPGVSASNTAADTAGPPVVPMEVSVDRDVSGPRATEAPATIVVGTPDSSRPRGLSEVPLLNAPSSPTGTLPYALEPDRTDYLVSPIGEVAAVRSILWERVEPGWVYHVEVVDAEGAALFQASTTDTVVALPETVELATDVPYRWILTATDADSATGLIGIATFRIR